MKIQYCEICDVRLTPEAFEMGDAVLIEGVAYCRDCARKLQGRAPSETVILNTSDLQRKLRPGPESSGMVRALSGGAAAKGMTKARLKCPRCSTHITADIPRAGGQVVCGVCGTTLSVKPKRAAARRRRRRRLR